MIELRHDPIDVAGLLQGVRSPAAGAVVLFLGTVREMTDGRQVRWLEYEAYADMARQTLLELENEARHRWPLVHCAIVHRLGRIEVGETALAIAASAAHRQPAFEAAQWLLERIKQVLPVWKKECWTDGTSQWVHPGVGRWRAEET